MHRHERERFLADVRVGVLGVEDGRGDAAPLLVPVWYRYTPDGTLVVQTPRDAVKTRLLRQAGRFSLCVQDERPPYRYVSVEGPIVDLSDPADPVEREALALRYLPPDEAVRYLDATGDQLTSDITVWMRPQRWRSADFSEFAKRFAGPGGSPAAAPEPAPPAPGPADPPGTAGTGGASDTAGAASGDDGQARRETAPGADAGREDGEDEDSGPGVGPRTGLDLPRPRARRRGGGQTWTDGDLGEDRPAGETAAEPDERAGELPGHKPAARPGAHPGAGPVNEPVVIPVAERGGGVSGVSGTSEWKDVVT
ncbi:pyridoxamine 5'-phosphate oxidase family protein [Bailinhaonella thermotolerans]|nr:pyridoxamine 5'-phosphate oxidase family protein [Bailinhaonella thermotolerans]